MGDRKLNEKESLELIAQMIQNTRRNLGVGSGNMFLIWGYVCAFVTLAVWAGIYFTDNQAWLWGFWAIPVLGWLLSWRLQRRHRQEERVKDYGSQTLMMLWIYMGVICFVVASYATVSLIIPGHALNRMARKEAKEVSHV